MYRDAQDIDEPPEIRATLRALADRLPAQSWPDAAQPKPVLLSDGVHDLYRAYDRTMFDTVKDELIDPRLGGTYTRLSTQAIKIAIILAAYEWPESASDVPIIELRHMHRALAISETWRHSAHRALKTAAKGRFATDRERVLRVIRRRPDGTTRRELNRELQNLEPRTMDETLNALEQEGTIIAREARGKRGPGTIRYVETTE
jgi:hypothetical protein